MQSLTGLAWRNLTTHRTQTLVSVLAVMLGVAIAIASDMVTRSARAGILQSDELRVMMAGLLDMADPMMVFIGLAILLAAGFLIFNTFNMAITRQRQQIGSLRMLGMTRRQVQTIILVEASLIAVTGAALGALVSVPLGHLLIAFMKQLAGEMIALGRATPSAITLAWASLGGILVTIGAVWLPARRATRVTPLDALRQPEAAGMQRASHREAVLSLTVLCALIGAVVIGRPSEKLGYPWDIYATAALIFVWCGALAWFIPVVMRGVADLIARLTPHATLRLMADNLQRARGRVTMTTLSFMLAILVLVGLTGFIRFFTEYGIISFMRAGEHHGAIFVSRVDIAGGWGRVVARNQDTVLLTDAELAAILETTQNDALPVTLHFVIIPELASLGEAYFTYMVNPDLLRAVDDALFTFSQGDWETALPIMRAGCGALVTPSVAERHSVEIGDTLTISGLHGPLECTIAGIGAGVANASFISDTVHEQLTDLNPVMVFMVPRPGISTAELEARVLTLRDTYPDITVTPVSLYLTVLDDSLNMVTNWFNTLLLLALAAAAMAVINTLLISVEERRREIGLLRAVGATQSQVRRIITGEAVLMGIVGSVLGCIAGAGSITIMVFTYGVDGFGTEHLHTPPEILAGSLSPALGVALMGIMAAPLIAALAAWGPAARILREKPVNSLALR